MSAVASDQQNQLLGRIQGHEQLSSYESPPEYVGQGDVRVVKHIWFTYHVITPSPMLVGLEVIQERTKSRGQTVPVSELGILYLEKGERLGAFYTSDELAALARGVSPVAVNSGTLTPEGVAPNYSEWGESELAAHIKDNKLTVPQTVDLAQGDKDAAKRVLEAEKVATDGEPRQGVIDGLSRIIGEA